ncbi:calmodulin binding protein PICBP-like isoform X2 [Gastrolobium bilobum]|uniref:calmodulin binding protein PICBP-like isoform X2 n=1 Tax=Gastrolobium bilobum TaxID=150636 RepID=UPI002AB07AAB|nr:calmodulin binding protein PICBP-like isoform X2 [Gastrolobium bilobum]
MKGTSSSHAKDSFQSTQRLIKNKTLTRMSTLKLKRSVTRKLFGRTEPKRKLNSSRSIKLATFKGQKSKRNHSESIYGSDGQNRKSTSDMQSESYAGNKSQRVITRRLSLKPVRFLTKMPTFKSKNSSMEKGPKKMSQSQDSSLHKATCSSTLKGSHFPDHIELPQEGSGSQEVSAMKVCPYTYCSLHGHRHGNLPPLKRFVSMRRRVLKTQKIMKMDGQPVTRSKKFGNVRKDTQKTITIHSEEDSKVTETAGNDKNIAACKKNDESGAVESTSTDAIMFSASDIEMLEGEVTTKGKKFEPDYEVLQMSSAQKEPKPASTTDVAYGMQQRDHKYIKMWHLMYKHAVLSNTGKCENKLPFDEKDKQGSGHDALLFDGVNSSSCQDYCETDQDKDDENKNVIELVQKAFDEILLPEPEDLSSDDHFKSRGIGSHEVILEKSEGKREETNASTCSESPKEAQKMGTKPDKKTPKSWSNLKKLILLKRFVKALEKIRNINLRRPRLLPSDANLEAEKVFLKHQTAEERKNAEEWKLDYALQKVISTLAPAQRQRVALLVEAFETILPFQNAENGQESSATVQSQANPIQSLDDSSDHSKEETDKAKDYGYSAKIFLGKTSCFHNSTMEFADNASDNPMPELHIPVVIKESSLDYLGANTVKNRPASGATEEDLNGKQDLASSHENGEKISNDNDNIYLEEVKDSRSWSLSKPIEIISSCHEEAQTNEVPEDFISNLHAENPNIKCESPGRDFETKNPSGDNREQTSVSKSSILEGLVRSLRSNLVGSGAPSNLLDEQTEDRKERIEKAKLETGSLEEFPTHEQSEAPMSAVGEPETQPEKQSYNGLWYLVYKHMASDAAENSSQSLIDGADEKESGYEGSRTIGTSVSYESTPMINQDMHFKDHVVVDPEVELQQIEAIKMVEEAIDSILPDVQDHLPDNTVSNNSKHSDRTERVCSGGLNQKEERMESGNGINQEQEEEGSAPKEGNKPNQSLSRSWSNLKKVILLRRFIKALEKVRKFNPRGPRYLPIEPDSEAEKVHLRHQDMEERKGTEEWMLDYALRQVVSKLTPARKRKVELLVEAFETVIPTTKN